MNMKDDLKEYEQKGYLNRDFRFFHISDKEELDIPYLAFNFPIDSCLDCGYQGEFNNKCPECGSTNIQQLRRVTGYLSTDYRNFNDGKKVEVEERVKHSLYTD